MQVLTANHGNIPYLDLSVPNELIMFTRKEVQLDSRSLDISTDLKLLMISVLYYFKNSYYR